MNRRDFLKGAAAASSIPSLMTSSGAASSQKRESAGPALLDHGRLRSYVKMFNRHDVEIYAHTIPNEEAYDFLKGNIPLLDCPDTTVERTYYFRWWTYRKHLSETPEGFVITEFQPDVPWGGRYNTIPCAAGHHFYEGRWMHESRYLDDYARFWLYGGGDPRNYSFWAADAMLARHLVDGRKDALVELLDGLVKNYSGWVSEHQGRHGLFHQTAGADGMEHGIGGDGYRPTINSYMYGDALAISRIAEMAERTDLATEYASKARKLREAVHNRLWDPGDGFFKVLPRNEQRLVDGRELLGYCPWYFNMPREGHEDAWRALMDPDGFYAPCGPTTAEQSHPGFAVPYSSAGCSWNGPSWPYATAQTLTALANVLNNYDQDVVTKLDYARMLQIYARSHQLQREDESAIPWISEDLEEAVVPWIDEELDPFTGDWVIRTLQKSGRAYRGFSGPKGKDYNHSTFCDLVISGLIGLRPREDATVEVNPLVPQGWWRYFCLDNIPYRGHALTILWDRTGGHYGKGQGLHVFADGQQVASSANLSRVTGALPGQGSR